MDIEQEIEKIKSRQKQLEIANKRYQQWLRNNAKGLRDYHIESIIGFETRINNFEGNIRRLGERIGNLEKQIEKILLSKSSEKD